MPLEPLFHKPAGDFQSRDLDGLRTLEEGWFVEFKDRAPETSKLARSISSFANSHGGLLVIGAKEEQKTRRLEKLTPVSREAAEQCVVRAREAVTAHVVPAPFFEAKAVEVDSVDAGVAERWVVVISVPKGRHGPYLHSNGCIYVRLGDAAAPHPLADLTQQERLWSESMSRKAKLKTRVESLSEQLRQGTPSIHLVILAEDTVAKADLSFEVFREIALAKHAKNAGTAFDQAQTIDTSYVARRTEQSVEAVSVVWDYDSSRNLHFIQIPIATHIWTGKEIDNRADQFGLGTLAEMLRTRGVGGDLMILNLQPTLYFLSIVLRKVQLLHRRQGYNGTLKLNAAVVDARGTLPFLNTPTYFSEVEATNFPYVLRDVGFFRMLDDTSGWLNLKLEGGDDDLSSHLQVELPMTMAVFLRVAQSLGIAPAVSFGLRLDDLDSVDWQPFVQMFTSVHTGAFSFTSQHNRKARR
ncbi:MAG: ATP-binding protein [Burkholderiales bacterium]|nr:ATP-binding protein [Burkholderiales bacterium]